MKFELKQNIFATGIKKVNLSDKEADYIVSLASGVAKEKIIKSLSITEEEIENLYLKFGLKNEKRIRDNQLITLACMSNFISEYCAKNADKKFEFPECEELTKTLNEIRTNDQEYKKEIEKMAEEIILEHFNKGNENK